MFSLCDFSFYRFIIIFSFKIQARACKTCLYGALSKASGLLIYLVSLTAGGVLVSEFSLRINQIASSSTTQKKKNKDARIFKKRTLRD